MPLYVAAAIAFVAGVTLCFVNPSQVTQNGGVFIWGAGLTLLVYGLVRDLYLVARGHEEEDVPKVRMAMTCFESLAGFSALALGLALQWAGWAPEVTLPAGAVVAGMAAVVAFGHGTRDWVLLLVVVPNHRNMIPTLRPSRFTPEMAASLESQAPPQ